MLLDNHDINTVVVRLISEAFAAFAVDLFICEKEIEGVRCICGRIQEIFNHVRSPTVTVIERVSFLPFSFGALWWKATESEDGIDDFVPHFV